MNSGWKKQVTHQRPEFMPRSTSTLQDLLQDLRQRLARHYGDDLAEVILFGSQARGDADASSDVDVLIVLRRPVPHPGLEIDDLMNLIYDLTLAYEMDLSIVPMSEAAYRTAQSSLIANVRREGVLV